MNLLKTEPAVLISLLTALIGLAVAFGVNLTSGQVGAISAVLTVIGGLFVRSQVTPVAKPPPMIRPRG